MAACHLLGFHHECTDIIVSCLEIPVFAIWGEHDSVVKLEEVRTNLMDRIPKISLFVIPNAGHLPIMEQMMLFNTTLFEKIIRSKSK